jgi:hypothetical protein
MEHTAGVQQFVYFPGEPLDRAELAAARIDGHLVELGEGYVPADLVESVALRAATLRPLLGDALAATHLTAAWVHGAVDEQPSRWELQRAVPHRTTHLLNPRVKYRDMQVDAHHLQRIGGVLVTSPARTLADLARSRGADRAIRSFASTPRAARDAIVVLALQENVPGKVAAIQRLRRIERERERRYDEVTRYTS